MRLRKVVENHLLLARKQQKDFAQDDQEAGYVPVPKEISTEHLATHPGKQPNQHPTSTRTETTTPWVTPTSSWKCLGGEAPTETPATFCLTSCRG